MSGKTTPFAFLFRSSKTEQVPVDGRWGRYFTTGTRGPLVSTAFEERIYQRTDAPGFQAFLEAGHDIASTTPWTPDAVRAAVARHLALSDAKWRTDKWLSLDSMYVGLMELGAIPCLDKRAYAIVAWMELGGVSCTLDAINKRTVAEELDHAKDFYRLTWNWNHSYI